ncbi:hypothetical protein ES695_13655 [Candidatus Atribacteria bacterium 1244-E10-H5-B2]|nr:MAG: hypothetical protein ES695_13655 [Candidatus Atribacteria bacterium 1244-E10-H5-B2]
MIKKIDENQLIRDFHEGKLYAEIALKHKCGIGTVAYWLGKLGLKRNKQDRELFSAEEKDFMRSLIGTYRGRKQLLDILRDE